MKDQPSDVVAKLTEDLKNHQDSAERIRQAHEKAFVKNDLGEPDFEGHRLYHTRSIKNAQDMENYKTGMTRTFLDWVVKGFLAIVVAGIISIVSKNLLDW